MVALDEARSDRPTASSHRSADARAAGAPSVSEAVHRDWGGYTGYFADPDGFRWEVAHNPGPIGQLVLPPVSDTT